jgi:hypothetical protein
MFSSRLFIKNTLVCIYFKHFYVYSQFGYPIMGATTVGIACKDGLVLSSEKRIAYGFSIMEQVRKEDLPSERQDRDWLRRSHLGCAGRPEEDIRGTQALRAGVRPEREGRH